MLTLRTTAAHPFVAITSDSDLRDYEQRPYIVDLRFATAGPSQSFPHWPNETRRRRSRQYPAAATAAQIRAHVVRPTTVAVVSP
jgi:hypothetical protein